MKRIAIAAALLAASFVGQAQDFPSKPLTMIVPFPPGGSVDVVARALGARFGQHIGQNVVALAPGMQVSLGSVPLAVAWTGGGAIAAAAPPPAFAAQLAMHQAHQAAAAAAPMTAARQSRADVIRPGR